jgi:hypothetical protein
MNQARVAFHHGRQTLGNPPVDARPQRLDYSLAQNASNAGASQQALSILHVNEEDFRFIILIFFGCQDIKIP